MTHRVRAVVLTGFTEVARFVGLDPYDQLRRVHIRPSELSDPQRRIPARLVVDLLERCADESARPDFALLLAECRTFSSLGPVSLLLKHEASLRRIIDKLDEFKRHLNDIASVHLEEQDGVAVLQWAVPPLFGKPQVSVLVAAIAYRALSDAMDGSWVPEAIHLPISRPDDPRTFERYFASSIEFNSHFTAFSFPAADLDRKNPGADTEMAEHARSLLLLVPRPPETIVERTQHALLLMLPVGRGTVESVARNLGVHPRTLQRELTASGFTFAQLLEETRRGLTTHYLAIRSRSVSEVAALVGYSNVSSFSRWFADHFGVSPSRWRQENCS